VSSAVEHARQEWEEGHRRLEAEARDRTRADALYAQLEAVLAELRRRVGETFTIEELARVYSTADDWSREAVAERAAGPGWTRTLSTVEAAAFHVYARGAVDYVP
jgi:glutathione S-transferase